MQIIAQSNDRLVMRDSPWGLRGMGALFGSLGIGLLVLMVRGGHGHEHNAWVGFVVSSMFAVVGVVMVFTSADRQVAFDRATRTAVLSRHGGVLRPFATEVPFGSIRDIALESSMMPSASRGSASITYRIVFVLRDGSRLPWTTVLTGDVGRQSRCVAAARAFGGWDAAAAKSGAATTEVARPTPSPGMSAVSGAPSRLTPAPTPFLAQAARPATTQNLGCVGAFLGLFMLVGLGIMANQVDRYLVWRPVPATVLSSQVGTVKGSKGGTSYKPIVTYTYRMNGQAYTAFTATIINESSSSSWARKIVSRYPAGTQTTAYVDPKDFSHAFLVHELSYLPLLFVLIPLLFGTIVVLSMRWNSRQAALAAALPVPVLNAPTIAPQKAA
jgi:hypothetical protein